MSDADVCLMPLSDANTLLSGTGIFPQSAVSCDHPSSSGRSSLLLVPLSAVLTLSSGSESLHCMRMRSPI